MPITIPPPRIPHLPRIFILLFPIGLFVMGLGVSDHVADTGRLGVATVTRHGTEYRTETRTVRRVVKGDVITLQGGTRVVHVPLIVVHADHKTIRVPAHNLPIHHKGGDLQAAIVATPTMPVTVTVYVPTTVYPEAATVTSTVTTTDTTWVPTTVTTTITLPLEPTGGLPTTDD